MNDKPKPRQSGIAGIGSVVGGLIGALSRFRVIGREVRDLAEDLAHIPGEIHKAQSPKSAHTEDAEQSPSHEMPEFEDVIDQKLEKIKPSRLSKADLPPGWNLPKPHKLPRPTYWPAVLAGGVVVFAWGPPTSWVVSVVGGVVSIIAIRGWIGELRHESKSE